VAFEVIDIVSFSIEQFLLISTIENVYLKLKDQISDQLHYT